MRVILPILTITYCILVSLGNFEVESDDPNAIEAHSWEYYQVNRSDEIQKNCESDEMIAYGLGGDAISLSEKNELCPNISQNCCGKQDQARLWEYWHRDRKRQEFYHRTVLKIMKYFLGFGMEWKRIGEAIVDDYNQKLKGLKNKNQNGGINRNEFEDGNNNGSGLFRKLTVNANKYCFNAARDFIRMDFTTKEKAHTYYNEISKKTEFMENARRGFYCMLCSTEGQRAIDTWIPFIGKAVNNIRFNDAFCSSIIRHSFSINYHLFSNYNKVLSNLMKMVQCVSVEGNGDNLGNSMNTSGKSFKSSRPPTKLSKEEKKMIANPLNLESHFKMWSCQYASSFLGSWACRYYCGKFNIAKPTPIMDGDAMQLKILYDKFKQFENVFVTSRINFFNDDMTRLNRDILSNYDNIDRSGLFYKTISSQIDISKYITNFWVGGSRVDPMEVARGCPLPMNYKGAGVLVAVIGLVLGLVY